MLRWDRSHKWTHEVLSCCWWCEPNVSLMWETPATVIPPQQGEPPPTHTQRKHRGGYGCSLIYFYSIRISGHTLSWSCLLLIQPLGGAEGSEQETQLPRSKFPLPQKIFIDATFLPFNTSLSVLIQVLCRYVWPQKYTNFFPNWWSWFFPHENTFKSNSDLFVSFHCKSLWRLSVTSCIQMLNPNPQLWDFLQVLTVKLPSEVVRTRKKWPHFVSEM